MSGAARIRLTQLHFSAALVIALMVAGAFACKSDEYIEIVNRTGEVIMIGFSSDDRFAGHRFVVEPGESVTLGTPVGTGMTFTVYDYGNTLIAELGFSWEEVRAQDFQLTVPASLLTAGD